MSYPWIHDSEMDAARAEADARIPVTDGAGGVCRSWVSLWFSRLAVPDAQQ